MYVKKKNRREGKRQSFAFAFNADYVTGILELSYSASKLLIHFVDVITVKVKQMALSI